MLQAQKQEKDIELWQQVVNNEVAYIQTRQSFFAHCKNRVEALKQALHSPVERGTALRVLDYLPVEERQSLLDDLVDLASVAHADIALCRQVILSLPKIWLLSNIEKSAEPLLQAGAEEEYRRLLELYVELDKDLAERLARRASQHREPDVQEVGEDFLSYLGQQSLAPAV